MSIYLSATPDGERKELACFGNIFDALENRNNSYDDEDEENMYYYDYRHDTVYFRGAAGGGCDSRERKLLVVAWNRLISWFFPNHQPHYIPGWEAMLGEDYVRAAAAMNRDGIAIELDTPGAMEADESYFMLGCHIMRLPWSYPNTVIRWATLVDHGVLPHDALRLACALMEAPVISGYKPVEAYMSIRTRNSDAGVPFSGDEFIALSSQELLPASHESAFSFSFHTVRTKKKSKTLDVRCSVDTIYKVYPTIKVAECGNPRPSGRTSWGTYVGEEYLQRKYSPGLGRGVLTDADGNPLGAADIARHLYGEETSK